MSILQCIECKCFIDEFVKSLSQLFPTKPLILALLRPLVVKTNLKKQTIPLSHASQLSRLRTRYQTISAHLYVTCTGHLIGCDKKSESVRYF